MHTITYDIESVALTIDELLSPAYEALPEHERDAQLAQQRLARWIAISADGIEANFRKRLECENRSMEWVLERLSGVRRCAGYSEPDWVGKTRRVFDVLTHDATFFSPQEELAFAPLLAPLVDCAASALRAALPEVVTSFLVPAVFNGAVDHLRRRLSNLCELPFYEVLLDWRRSLVTGARCGGEAAGRELQAGTREALAAYLRS